MLNISNLKRFALIISLRVMKYGRTSKRYLTEVMNKDLRRFILTSDAKHEQQNEFGKPIQMGRTS